MKYDIKTLTTTLEGQTFDRKSARIDPKGLAVVLVAMANTDDNSRELRPFNRFPNPATNAVRIIPGGERVTAVRLVSALGQPLPAPLSAGRIDLSALPAGIYYLSIITETTSYQHKIVKR